MALSGVKKQQTEKRASESCEDGSSSDDGSDCAVQGNAGWADSITKVLNTSKPKTKKTLVLSRAKKTKPGKQNLAPDDYGFEVEGEIKEEKHADAEVETKEPKNKKLELRVKPSWKDIERERTLRKVATKGVVQLFNAVRIQQKDLEHQLEAAGPLDSRKEAVLKNMDKRKFLDVLMGGKRSKSVAVDGAVKHETKKEDQSDDDYDNRKRKPEWNVLSDDFMTNKKNKHWDQEEDDSDDQQRASDSDE